MTPHVQALLTRAFDLLDAARFNLDGHFVRTVISFAHLSYTSNTAAQLQNYRRSSGGTIPLLGINRFFSGGGNQIVSVPYFAERRVNTAVQSMAAQLDDTNKTTLVHAGATEAHTYFGCWLDFNQTDPQFPVSPQTGADGPFTGRVPILQLVRGIHQCLVAEIR